MQLLYESIIEYTDTGAFDLNSSNLPAAWIGP